MAAASGSSGTGGSSSGGTNVDLTNLDLRTTNLSGTNLTGANLTGSNLTGQDLTDRNLTGTNLTNANLTNVNLTNVNLTNADLTGADLTGANLTGVTVTGANFTNASGLDTIVGSGMINTGTVTLNNGYEFISGLIAKAATLEIRCHPTQEWGDGRGNYHVSLSNDNGANWQVENKLIHSGYVAMGETISTTIPFRYDWNKIKITQSGAGGDGIAATRVRIKTPSNNTIHVWKYWLSASDVDGPLGHTPVYEGEQVLWISADAGSAHNNHHTHWYKPSNGIFITDLHMYDDKWIGMKLTESKSDWSQHSGGGGSPVQGRTFSVYSSGDGGDSWTYVGKIVGPGKSHRFRENFHTDSGPIFGLKFRQPKNNHFSWRFKIQADQTNSVTGGNFELQRLEISEYSGVGVAPDMTRVAQDGGGGSFAEKQNLNGMWLAGSSGTDRITGTTGEARSIIFGYHSTKDTYVPV